MCAGRLAPFTCRCIRVVKRMIECELGTVRDKSGVEQR